MQIPGEEPISGKGLTLGMGQMEDLNKEMGMRDPMVWGTCSFVKREERIKDI